MLSFSQVVMGTRLALGLTRERLAQSVGVTAETVRCWENGHQVPTLANRRLLAGALNLPVEVLVRTGGGAGRPPEPLGGPVTPYQPVTDAVILDLARGWLAIPAQARPPSDPGAPALDEAVVGVHEELLAAHRRLADTIDPGALLPALRGAVDVVLHQAQSTRYPRDLGRRLFLVLAETARLTAWVYREAGAPGDAQRWYVVALRAAHHAGLRGLGAHIIGSLAALERRHGNPRAAVVLLELARDVTFDALCLTERALLQGRLALAHAAAGDRAPAERAIDASFAALARSDAADDPPWVAAVTAATLTQFAGAAYLEVDDRPRAAHYLREAAAGHTDRSGRQRGRCQAGLARLTLDDDLDHACDLGDAAAGAAIRYSSALLLDDLRPFATALTARRRLRRARTFLNGYQHAELLVALHSPT